MYRLLIHGLLVLSLLWTAVMPVLAQDDTPEPFCGKLDEEDCDLLRASRDAMLDLETYTTTITYRLIFHDLPEIPVPQSETVLKVAGQFAFDDAARQSMRRLALISSEEPLAAMAEIGNSPDLLLDLYKGMTANLVITLDLTEEWTDLLADEAEVEWPLQTNVEVRLVDGVLYFDIHELKPMLPELEELNDWVAIEMVKSLEELAESGMLRELSADVASSTTGRSVQGLDPAMISVITSMRSAFGRPEVLEAFMDIERQEDADLDGQAGAVFKTDFAVLDFIFSDEFRDLLQQVVEVAAASEGDAVAADETKQVADVFWLVAPMIFRDLEISGETTEIGRAHV